jgi:hypothetical protein
MSMIKATTGTKPPLQLPEGSSWTRYYDGNIRICAHLATLERARKNRQGITPGARKVTVNK